MRPKDVIWALRSCRLTSSTPKFLPSIAHILPRRQQIRHINASRSLYAATTEHESIGGETSGTEPSSKHSLCWKHTIIAHQPSLTTKEEIISQLLSHETDDKSTQKKIAPFLIMTTPSFSTWLEDDDFISQLLQSVMPSHRPIVQVVSAVVDKLPLPDHEGSSGGEGFALLSGPKRGSFGPVDGKNDRACLLFSLFQVVVTSNGNSQSTLPIQLIMPMAQTIFQNGKESTLLRQFWVRSESGVYTRVGKTKEMKTLRISLGEIGASQALVPHVAVIPLTEPRKIVSSAGNIIRQISTNDGTIIPASQELEASVNNAFEKLNLPPTSLKVWAVLSRRSPATSVQGEDTESIAYPPRTLSEDLTYVNLTDFCHRDSSIHQVLSGGGGWGQKEGLLALDPQSDTDFYEAGVPESQTPFEDIASTDSFIQFFLPANSSAEHVKQVETEPEPVDHDSLQPKHTMIFGSTPSTIDQMPQTQGDNGEHSDRAKFSVYKSHFGALSEDGIFYVQRAFRLPKKPEYSRVRGSRLNVPGSSVSVVSTIKT